MTTNIRTFSVCLLLAAGACASRDHAGDSHARHNTSGDETADAADTRSAQANPDNLPGEPEGDVEEHTRPGRLASDVPGAVNKDKDAPPVVPLEDTEAAPDNTAVNERDRNNATLTPGDQGSSDRDLEITQRIRETVIDNDQLSFTAKNVKIITVDGRVTLRGPVRNENERRAIEKAAVTVAGAGQVANGLEIR
jgi:hyperosmotically inducible protein